MQDMFDENGNLIGFDLNQGGPTIPSPLSGVPVNTQSYGLGAPAVEGADIFGNPLPRDVLARTGVPQVDPIMSISPGGTNEIVGLPQTDLSGGFETRLEPFIGPTMPPEYQSDIGAPVTETPPELRAGAAAATGTAATGATGATGTAAAGTGADIDPNLVKAGAESNAMKAAGAATGVGQIVGGITNIVMGVNALNDVNIAEAQSAVDDAYATRPGLGTPVEFYNMQKEAYDQRLMAMRLEDINRGLATNVAAAQQYGARGLGATLAATAQAQRAQQQEVLQQQRLQTSALGTLAQAREREIQRREQRATFDIGIAYDQLKAEQAREQYAKQQIAQGIVGTASGIARTAVTFGAEQGAKVTPGEFSHETNPIDIVQEGTKIGEMTGGEYIFNPQQAGKMAREAKKGNSPLHKFVRKTLNKFHKDAEKYEGK